MLKTILLPRQARDKHQEKLRKGCGVIFAAGLTAGWDWNTALTINPDGSAVSCTI